MRSSKQRDFDEICNLCAWIVVTLILLAISNSVSADDWSKADTTRQMVYTALLTVDALTTIDIGNHDEIQEAAVATRQILGHNPEALPTIGYFTVVGIANYYVAKSLPAGKWRTSWQTGSAILSGSYVLNNWRLGLRPTFK